MTVALLTLGAASAVNPGDPLFAAPASLLTPVAAYLLVRAAKSRWTEAVDRWTFLAPVAAGATVTFGRSRLEGTPLPAIRVWAVMAVIIALLTMTRTRSHRFQWLWLGLLIGTALAWLTFSGMVSDIWLFHHGAAERIAGGGSPYSGLAVPNGAPSAPRGAIATGYPYPVVALLPFAIADLAGLDPRLGSAGAWLVTCALVSLLVARSHSSAAGVAFLLSPAWIGMLWIGFTEPVSILLFAGVSVLAAFPVTSGVLLGLALASKQYLFVLAPLLLAPVVRRDRRVILATVSTAGMGVVIGFVWDSIGFWNSAVLYHLVQQPRIDTIGPLGLLFTVGWVPPYLGLIAVMFGLFVAWRLRNYVNTWSQWLLAAAAVLAVTFCLTPQAFPNYWFLVLCLVLLAQIAEDRPAGSRVVTTP